MSLKSFREGRSQLLDDKFGQAQPLQKVPACKDNEHRAKKYQRKNGKERTKKEPADEEFFGTVGISGEAKKQSGKCQGVKSNQETVRKALVKHRMHRISEIADENKKDGEATDTERPAQSPFDIGLPCRPSAS